VEQKRRSCAQEDEAFIGGFGGITVLSHIDIWEKGTDTGEKTGIKKEGRRWKCVFGSAKKTL